MDELRESGNEAFKKGNFELAVQYYSDCIQKSKNETQNEKEFENLLKKDSCLQKCFNNRSQCYLKLQKYSEAVNDATSVLLAVPDDTKALFRRAQAFKELSRLEESLLDAKRLLSIDSNNKACFELMKNLTRIIQDKSNEQRSTKSQTKSMLDLAKNETGEKQSTALNNLIVLSREEAGSNEILAADGIETLKAIILKPDISDEIKLGITRIFASICKGSFKRATIVFNQLQAELIEKLISSPSEPISTAASLIVQNIIYSITDLENKRKIKKQINEPYDFSREVLGYIDEIFRSIVMLIMDPKCSGYGRDNCIDLCLKFVDRANGCGWTTKFIVFGVPKLLRVAATIPELNMPNSLPLTEHTKMHVSCCLSAVFDDTYSDKERESYHETCSSFIKDLLERENDNNAKLKAIACLGVILQGPFDAGSQLIVKFNLLNLMLDFADSDDAIQEKIAVEAVVYSASKKDKATGILSEGIDILKKLYNSKNQSIKVRALVGLCKLASCKGSDASVKLLAEGSSTKLEFACRNILAKATDYDSKKWACDGLAYLTLDAEVKELVANDPDTLKRLYDLTKKDDKNTLYSIATILSNLANAQPQKKASAEMVKLAEYAKHHIPEMHEKEKDEYFMARRKKLMDSGVSQALTLMSKHNSSNCKELIASIYLVLCEEPENRGKIVAAGGGKALIPLALEGTDIGTTRAGRALAKIAISINPELAFPGQRCLEVVRPLIKLLHPDKEAIENYEALMALTNLAGVDSSVRKRILKEQGLSNIEQYMFEEHEDLRRAGTECVCNLAQDDDLLFFYEKTDNDRIKLLILYCGEEDIKLNYAASGALAQLSERSEKICNRIVEVKSFVPIFKQAACMEDIALQFRIFYIIDNIVKASKELCTRIVESELMEVIVALTRIDVEPDRQKVKNLANDIVKTCLEHELIKPTMASFADTAIKEDDEQ